MPFVAVFEQRLTHLSPEGFVDELARFKAELASGSFKFIG